MKIGIIGIGAMDMAMAKNLHRQGFAVTVRDIRQAAASEKRIRLCRRAFN